jgi:hypothetical protein
MNNSQLSLANRKQLTDLLKSGYGGTLRQKAKDKYSEKYSHLERAFLDTYAEQKGAKKLLAQILTMESELLSLQQILNTSGFEVRRGILALADNAPDSLKEAIESDIAKSIGTRGDIDDKFDAAQITMMTIGSLEEAQKLLKSLIV